ncbi:hypothetical protein M422DRAFT_265604 [Sphaerobolus stellatus SS14]|uniref:Uncharacterized protein n=1 Tax=Sphaerobolus stellatus (strain SS14) TaxID=990650 RepID=A0A0C9UCY5_SPHS4|nr:hypothetical protein M422DRAFT_265604 [Sphaerobolus stellatus SS14]
MERPKAFTTLADSIHLAIIMWSTPGTEPTLFLPEAFVCFLEGAISVLPASTQQAMKQYLGSLPKHQSDTLLYHQNDVMRVNVLVWRAQSFGSALKPEMIPNLHLLDNLEGKVEWHHFGIPVANEAFTKGQPSAFITTPQRPNEFPGAKINLVNLTPKKCTPALTNPFRTSTATSMSAVDVTPPQHTRQNSVSSAISSSPQHLDSPSPHSDPSGLLSSSAQATSQNSAPQ